MLAKDEAICIRAIDYSETSQVVTFFAKATGKISAIAKGSKRPKSTFDGPIEVFSHGGVVFSDSNRDKLATLTEFEQEPNFSHLPNSLFVVNCCLFAAELLTNLTDEYDPHPGLFDSFLQYLKDTNESQVSSAGHKDVLALLILFQLALLKEVGLQPILDTCTNCKTQDGMRDTQYEAYFSSTANGLVCRDCEASFADKIRLTAAAANTLSDLKLLAEASEGTLSEIEKVLISHFTELLHKPPRMARYILNSKR